LQLVCQLAPAICAAVTSRALRDLGKLRNPRIRDFTNCATPIAQARAGQAGRSSTVAVQVVQ